MKPLAIDLFCGLGGWADGLIAAGWDVVGFDNGATAPCASGARYPGQLVLQDVLTLHGSQFRSASLIVASPPCQNYSYLAMPWSKSQDWARPSGDGWEVLNSAKAKAMREAWEREGPDNRLFDACFRIQREASEAAGRYIPMVVENVRGSRKWVAKPLKADYGSFLLYGDVGMVGKRIVRAGAGFGAAGLSGARRKANPGSFQTAAVESAGVKVPSESGRRTDVGKGARFTSRDCGAEAGTKIGGDWFSDPKSTCRKHGSGSPARKLASAEIAKIPLALAEHIGRIFYPAHVSRETSDDGQPLAQASRLQSAEQTR